MKYEIRAHDVMMDERILLTCNDICDALECALNARHAFRVVEVMTTRHIGLNGLDHNGNERIFDVLAKHTMVKFVDGKKVIWDV